MGLQKYVGNRFLYYKSKMLHRTASGPLTAKIGVDNMVTSLNQKDKIICILEKELEGFSSLRDNYQRLKDRRGQIVDKCDMLGRQILTTKGNCDRRVDQAQKNVMELKMMISGLEADLQNKHYLLKDLKFESENLVKESQERQNNLLQSGESIEHVKSTTEILKMESQRIFTQINQYKEDLERMRQYQQDTEATREKIKNQILNTQGFIRQLAYEEGRLTENLTIIEDQNNSIDEIIVDLGKVAEMTRQKVREVREEKEYVQLEIKSKELEKGRIQTEHGERQKQLKAEREKEKVLKEALDSKKNDLTRLNKILREVLDEADEIMKSNHEVETINMQLQKDLIVSRKHLDNVEKNNGTVQQQLELFYKVNVSAIKKLKKPMDESWVELGVAKRQLADFDTADGFQNWAI